METDNAPPARANTRKRHPNLVGWAGPLSGLEAGRSSVVSELAMGCAKGATALWGEGELASREPRCAATSLTSQTSPSAPTSAAPPTERLRADEGSSLGLLPGQIGISKPNLAARYQLAHSGDGSNVPEFGFVRGLRGFLDTMIGQRHSFRGLRTHLFHGYMVLTSQRSDRGADVQRPGCGPVGTMITAARPFLPELRHIPRPTRRS